ncbi:unnamed protein product [Tilletia controversa]|uniref:Uncharacterized protein n=3 Tax=Tilletia TaxID=13289 RepID=A0A8X7MYX2_9BASI|nr:hypothetical protein CF328_g6271 [Tilletia controversa]KAE8196630.1 hypothetical protein CF336_g2533 [Tilletia laevis]KAE8252913.1 hypothetical protein A4X03_0g6038 [Tilletia caries]KAE8207246.1 hypothetical protein CF335_g1288 [Tilletia laevis]KAE8254053.1 hypothetical protein A4X06_0g1091 [Tilletia controversa]
MHASSSRLITIRPFAKAAVAPANVRLPPVLKRAANPSHAARTPQHTPEAEGTQTHSHITISKAQKTLTTDTAAKLLLQREQAIRVADSGADGAAAAADQQGSPAVAALASSWPSNLRIEPEVNKRDLYWKVPTEKREQLRKMFKDTR